MTYRKIKLNKELHHEYTIDTLGVIRNETNGKVLKGTSISKNNRYTKAHLDKFYPIHRLVAEHFIDNKDNLPQVNHIDGNRYNNCVNNLEWCTPSYNVQHSYTNNLKTNKGIKNPISKLTEDNVIRIWSLRKTTLTARQIRDRLKLDVSIEAIKSVRQGKNWKHITNNLV